METLKNFAKEVDKITFNFTLNHKPAKISETIIIKKKTASGLAMKDFPLFVKALKLNWVKWLCSNTDAPWKFIPKMPLNNVGRTEPFKRNHDYYFFPFKVTKRNQISNVPTPDYSLFLTHQQFIT